MAINCSGSGVQFQRSTNGGVTWQAPIVIPNSPIYGTLMWTPTATSLLVVGAGEQHFAAFARATHRSGARHRLLTEAPLLASVAPSFRAG